MSEKMFRRINVPRTGRINMHQIERKIAKNSIDANVERFILVSCCNNITPWPNRDKGMALAKVIVLLYRNRSNLFSVRSDDHNGGGSRPFEFPHRRVSVWGIDKVNPHVQITARSRSL